MDHKKLKPILGIVWIVAVSVFFFDEPASRHFMAFFLPFGVLLIAGLGLSIAEAFVERAELSLYAFICMAAGTAGYILMMANKNSPATGDLTGPLFGGIFLAITTVLFLIDWLAVRKIDKSTYK